ncbi:MAG: PIG-L family deacetylase, partial [Chloroflexi bacterium]|nr:PIG-L family deacetylase [Chloroflexota bacterium]
AREGVAVHLACATRGEAGTVDPELLQDYASVGDLRWAELTCAAGALGLASVTHLGYRDSGMDGSADNGHPDALAPDSGNRGLAAAPPEEVAGRIVALIRRLRPQVVLTHDPAGDYGHPDHLALHRAALLAFEAAGDPARYPECGPAFSPARLYYMNMPRRLLRLALWVLPWLGQDPARFGRNKDIDLRPLAEVNFPITTVVRTREYAGVKMAASDCHRSQLAGGPPRRGPLSWAFRLAANSDSFTRARPPFNGNRKESGFFDGL